MVKKCFLCGKSEKSAGNFSFHRFPVQEIERIKWMQACKLDQNVDVNSKFLCSQHFKIADFDVLHWPKRRLLRGVVPTPSHVHFQDKPSFYIKSSTSRQQWQFTNPNISNVSEIQAQQEKVDTEDLQMKIETDDILFVSVKLEPTEDEIKNESCISMELANNQMENDFDDVKYPLMKSETDDIVIDAVKLEPVTDEIEDKSSIDIDYVDGQIENNSGDVRDPLVKCETDDIEPAKFESVTDEIKDKISLNNCGSVKKRRSNLNVREKEMIKNVYEGIRADNSNISVSEAVEKCSRFTKVSVRTVYNVLKPVKTVDHGRKRSETRGRKKILIDEDVKVEIRRKIHDYFFRNEIPNFKKIIKACAEDDKIPSLSRDVLRRTLREMNFRCVRQDRKSLLIEKAEIVTWRRNYLRQIRQFRNDGKKIYYLDETRLNDGRTISGSTRLKASNGKGSQLIAVHIGSDDGFLQNGLRIVESKRIGDFHEDMHADVFENWFASVLSEVEEGSVIVMDNAPYHSRRVEKALTTASRKEDIQDWLASKQIEFNNTMLKVELLEIVRAHKHRYQKYVIDEIAHNRDVTILRLPPYHSELNPIELIWAQIKGDVSQSTTTFKLNNVKLLLEYTISRVSADTWRNYIEQVKNEEQHLWDLDICIEVLTEPLIINGNGNSGSDSSTDDDNGSDSE